MIQLEDRLLRLVTSLNVEDVVIGFSLITKKYGWDYYEELIVEFNESKFRSRDYLYNIENYNTQRQGIIKLLKYKLCIHILPQYVLFNSYKDEWDKLIPGENYRNCGIVYEI